MNCIGPSNFSGWQLQKALDLSREMGWVPFVCLQPQYNLLSRSLEWEVMPVCLNEGLGVIPWSPLRGGGLSGKFRRGKPHFERRRDSGDRCGRASRMTYMCSRLPAQISRSDKPRRPRVQRAIPPGEML